MTELESLLAQVAAIAPGAPTFELFVPDGPITFRGRVIEPSAAFALLIDSLLDKGLSPAGVDLVPGGRRFRYLTSRARRASFAQSIAETMACRQRAITFRRRAIEPSASTSRARRASCAQSIAETTACRQRAITFCGRAIEPSAGLRARRAGGRRSRYVTS